MQHECDACTAALMCCIDPGHRTTCIGTPSRRLLFVGFRPRHSTWTVSHTFIIAPCSDRFLLTPSASRLGTCSKHAGGG